MKTIIHFQSYIVQFFLEWKMFQTTVLKKLETHSMFSNFFFEDHTLYEIMWNNFVELGRPEMTIWRKRIAFCISKATHMHTHRWCNTHSFSTETMVARTRLSVKLFVDCLSCWYVSLCSSAGRYENFDSPFCWSSGYETEAEEWGSRFLQRPR
jgi:hypothetical protein